MTRPITKLGAEKTWREAFTGFAAAPAWLAPQRKQAFQRFEEKGLPTPRTEDWRWSDIHRHLNESFPPLTGGEKGGDVGDVLAAQPFAAVDAHLLVFVDGRLDRKASRIGSEEGLSILSLAETESMPAWADAALSAGEDAIDLLNLIYVTDGALIHVAEGVALKRPVVIVNVATAPGRSMALRHVIRLEKGARLSLYEVQAGGGHNVSLQATVADLAEEAELVRIQVAGRDDEAITFANLQARVASHAALKDLTVIHGGRLHRQQDFVDLAGEGAETEVNAAYLLRHAQHADTRLVVNHLVPHGTSRETFKCVMDDQARGAFQGRIHVAPGAQKTDGQMAAHGLLLGEMAEFDAKPELEIYADDVICAHGATAGALDEEQLFYLRARGIPLAQARAMLIAAFVAETFDAIEDETVRNALQALAQNWLVGEAAA
ncbi:Fe-S cluster assembly protein SufD [Thermopetrobacter sp. TC1]|uniref:Fe-S cluster assembly protein SufD n=1 Tax=Thermopetrobacter sp. TC1 TaxID=1495045 RepID=UPI000691E4B0|nr:Fe-S cluster assembly protein SufD [Thermopetrobacter sp. TC1]